MDQKGAFTNFGDGHLRITNGGIDILAGFLLGFLYIIGEKEQSRTEGTANVSSVGLWHERLSHFSENGLAEMT